MVMIARDRSGEIASIVRGCVEPRRVILFGSRARGDARAESDWDVYVEVDDARHDADAERRALEGRLRAALTTAGLSGDVFVRSKRGFDEWRDDPGSIEWDVEREGVALYERPGTSPSRVHERPRSYRSIAGLLAKADEDFQAMEMLAAAEPFLVGPVGFHAHAGCEKLLKALVVSCGRRPERTHSLATLLARCPGDVRQAFAGQVVLLDRLFPRAEYHVEQEGPVTRQEAESAVAAARAIRDVVRSLVLGGQP